MTRLEALTLIDNHKNALASPVEMLNWTWLRVIISRLTDDEWQALLARAHPTLSA